MKDMPRVTELENRVFRLPHRGTCSSPVPVGWGIGSMRNARALKHL